MPSVQNHPFGLLLNKCDRPVPSFPYFQCRIWFLLRTFYRQWVQRSSPRLSRCFLYVWKRIGLSPGFSNFFTPSRIDIYCFAMAGICCLVLCVIVWLLTRLFVFGIQLAWFGHVDSFRYFSMCKTNHMDCFSILVQSRASYKQWNTHSMRLFIFLYHSKPWILFIDQKWQFVALFKK